MKAITANLLVDGRVVFAGHEGDWRDCPEEAARYDEAAAEAALAAVRARSTEIADAYLIDVDADGHPAGREALRERIRSSGPSVRPNLGKQAGGAV